MSAADTVLSAASILGDGARRAGTAPPTTEVPWVAALELLVRSANEEGGLHPAGAQAFGAKLTGFVAERLNAEALLAADSAVRTRPLPVRFAVAGLGRSGTTFLHRLLACDPDVEVLPTWQAFHPCRRCPAPMADVPRPAR